MPITIHDLPPRRCTRPTWAEVSLNTLRQNFRRIKQHVGGGVSVCAVVKADAYGHGAAECSAALESEGARWLGVTSLDEAVPLRAAGLESRILLMTGFWRGEEEEIVRLRLTPTVWEPWQIQSLERTAAKWHVICPVHLKVDTGMGRLGVTERSLAAVCSLLRESHHLSVEGLSTHLASSEVLDAPSAEEQLNQFEEVQQILRREGLEPKLVHVANTSAAISRPRSWSNMVRPGLALYGYYLPFQRAGREVSGIDLRLSVEPVLAWKTLVFAIRELRPNQPIGYGASYITKSATRIAILPVGYADGLNRALSNRGRVIVRAHYAPIVGRISMDLTVIDITGIPGVELGDEVTLLGSSGDLSVDASDHAEGAGTIPYEILCSISKRVPRKCIDQENELDLGSLPRSASETDSSGEEHASRYA